MIRRRIAVLVVRFCQIFDVTRCADYRMPAKAGKGIATLIAEDARSGLDGEPDDHSEDCEERDSRRLRSFVRRPADRFMSCPFCPGKGIGPGEREPITSWKCRRIAKMIFYVAIRSAAAAFGSSVVWWIFHR